MTLNVLQWLLNKIKNCEPSDAVLKSAKKAVTIYQSKLQCTIKFVSYVCFSCLPNFKLKIVVALNLLLFHSE